MGHSGGATQMVNDPTRTAQEAVAVAHLSRVRRRLLLMPSGTVRHCSFTLLLVTGCFELDDEEMCLFSFSWLDSPGYRGDFLLLQVPTNRFSATSICVAC
ncbi:unnamed protein product [Discosporangium mesarthrocarpum]